MFPFKICTNREKPCESSIYEQLVYNAIFAYKFKVIKMKVIAFDGSARKDGNTTLLIKKTLQVLEAEGIQTEFIQLAGEEIHGCKACNVCREKKSELLAPSGASIHA